MGGTNGISGRGNNYFKVSDFWSKPNLQAAKTEQTNAAAPIKLTGLDTVKRENLGELSPYAAMGVNISKKQNPLTEEFASEFGINPNISLTSQLSSKQIKNAESLAKVYAYVDSNYNQVNKNIEKPFNEYKTNDDMHEAFS